MFCCRSRCAIACFVLAESKLIDSLMTQVKEHSALQQEAQNIISWALESYPDMLMTSGFNLNGVVLLDLAVAAGFRGEVLFVDTGQHFSETLETRDALADRYPEVNIITLRASAETNLPPCGDGNCCSIRKIEPLRAYLAERQPSALLSARSRFQSETRALLNTIEDAGDYVKVNPLSHWSREALEAYAQAQDLPVNPLYWQGFLSIGCAPMTRAVRDGEDVRAGRWNGSEKLECGLWYGDKAI